MDNFAAARSQMGMSLGFHIVFAVIGVALPLMMTIAEWRFRATGDAAYLLLAKRWAKGTTILFAVGAVSGTVLSFELGLLWPQFMRYAGSQRLLVSHFNKRTTDHGAHRVPILSFETDKRRGLLGEGTRTTDEKGKGRWLE